MSLHHVCVCPCVTIYRCGFLREGTVCGQGAFTPEAGTNSCQSDFTCICRPRPPVHSPPQYLGMLAALHGSVLCRAFTDAPFSLSLVCPSWGKAGVCLVSQKARHATSLGRASLEPLDVEGVWPEAELLGMMQRLGALVCKAHPRSLKPAEGSEAVCKHSLSNTAPRELGLKSGLLHQSEGFAGF